MMLPEGTAHRMDTSSECHFQAIRDHTEQLRLAMQVGSTGHLRTCTATHFRSHNRTIRWSELTWRRTDQSSGHTPQLSCPRSPMPDGKTGPSGTTGRPSLACTCPGLSPCVPALPKAPKYHDHSRGWQVTLREGWSHGISDNCLSAPGCPT